MRRHVTCGQRDLLTTIMVACLCALLIAFIGCSDDNPVKPNPNPNPLPSDGEDLPTVPTLSSPTDDPPMRSESVTRVREAFDYAPQIRTAYADWHVRGHGIYEEWPTWINCTGKWRDLFGTASEPIRKWNHELPPFYGTLGACATVTPYYLDGYTVKIDEWPKDKRIVFIADGVKNVASNPVQWEEHDDNICTVEAPWGCISKIHIRIEYNATGPAIEKQPYLLRERFWEIKAWESGALVHRIDGDSETSMKTEYATGCDKTQTESFAWTLGATVGAEYKGLSAQIEGSITKSFGTSVMVSERTTTSVEKHLKGVAGKTTCHVMWVLVERYTFVHKNGDRFDDPNYVFHKGIYDDLADSYYDFEIRGTQEQVSKYIFD